MADLDSQVVQDGDVDLTDETQDFRFLKHLTKGDQTSLPRRGEKDFEPDGTNLQSTALDDSRQAMHDALSGLATHGSKVHVEATWRPSRSLAEVKAPKGPLFKNMGQADQTGTLWLLPEETIYLVERGNLECWWEEGIPMSLQAVYAACLEAAGGLEGYQVYAYLKRCGYGVFRTVERDTKHSYGSNSTTIIKPGWTLPSFNLDSILGAVFGFKDTRFGPLVSSGAYKSYSDVYKHLQIERHRGTQRVPSTPLKIHYDVYRPRPSFKKSDPGPADFIMTIIDARDTSLPSLLQINNLFDSLPKSASLADKGRNMYQRLKEGKRNCVLAVVDSGAISFVRFGDADFRDFKLYDEVPPKSKASIGGKNARKSSTKNVQSERTVSNTATDPTNKPGIITTPVVVA